MVLVVVTVGFFLLAAQAHAGSRLLWGGASLGLWCVAIFVFGWGTMGGLALQVALFFVMTVRNMLTRS